MLMSSFFLTLIYTEISSIVPISPGASQSLKHPGASILSNTLTTILFPQTQATSSSVLQQWDICNVAQRYC